jgi:hypothetical protein
MHITSSLTNPRRRSRKRGKNATTPGRERNKRANATQDAALYNCACGYIFKAAVTTNVGCPHCGTDQAW